jgi:hypothetical protein
VLVGEGEQALFSLGEVHAQQGVQSVEGLLAVLDVLRVGSVGGEVVSLSSDVGSRLATFLGRLVQSGWAGSRERRLFATAGESR